MKCYECKLPAKHPDPRTPPLDEGECLCPDCYKSALTDALQESIDTLRWEIANAIPILGKNEIHSMLEDMKMVFYL